jgi:hypothetical protein
LIKVQSTVNEAEFDVSQMNEWPRYAGR